MEKDLSRPYEDGREEDTGTGTAPGLGSCCAATSIRSATSNEASPCSSVARSLRTESCEAACKTDRQKGTLLSDVVGGYALPWYDTI